MVKRNAKELRITAQAYRDMCAYSYDTILKAALNVLADEFDSEAESLEARQNSKDAIGRLTP
jgi:hypothetical protein